MDAQCETLFWLLPTCLGLHDRLVHDPNKWLQVGVHSWLPAQLHAATVFKRFDSRLSCRHNQGQSTG